MTSVEKRRSSRKSGGRRKHCDGGFGSTSRGRSYLDETDREVSNLTDRAFRSLCIGEEAVYNDSDLSLSSPSTQRDRQLAFSQDKDIEERDREEQKRVAHENFSLRVQQYGQDWILGGTCGTEIHRDPQWGGYGGRTEGMVSATFQHSFVETSQPGKSLREEELSFFRNGATELSSQQHRSHSRVSSLVKAFNSEGHRDGAGIENNLRDWTDGTSWDRSALMSIQRELSEFSTSYQPNTDSHLFPSANQFSPQSTNFCSSQMGAMAQMSHNSASSYMRSSHFKHNMSAHSNFFIHSEFSPFKLWRDHNRFPFQQGDISGFMQRSEFPKWYATPMYKELSLENQPQGPYRDLRQPRNLALVAPLTHSTSASTVLQKASAVEKRCESELSSHYPHRKWTQSLGTNKLPSQRPSTASPTTEMSRRVKDTINSVKALQQKLKIMSEQNMTTGVMANQQGVLHGNEHVVNHGNDAITLEPHAVGSNTRTSFNTNQLLTPPVHPNQEAKTSSFQQHEASPQPVEHAPVRAESRGATPDIRMSSYKSRATSLLFNLKDNRKRVKSTYSPNKLKVMDSLEKNKQISTQEQSDPMRDNPVFPDSDMQLLQLQGPRRANVAVNQYHSPGLSLASQISQPERLNTIQYPENTSAQTQGQMVHHGFNGFIPENYTNNQAANGQNHHENLTSFTPHKQDHLESVEQLQPFYSAVDTAARLNPENNQSREYLISKANSEQAFNETVGRVFSKVDGYEQLNKNKQIYKNVFSQDKWRQTNDQDTGSFCQKTAQSQQDTAPSLEMSRQDNRPSGGKEPEKVELRESLVFGTPSLKKADLFGPMMSDQLEGQRGQRANEIRDDKLTQKYDGYTDQDHRIKPSLYPTADKLVTMQKTSPSTSAQTEHGNQSQQQKAAEAQFEIQKNTPAPTMIHQIKDRSLVDNKDGKIMAEQKEAQDSKPEQTKTQNRAHVEPPKAESVGFVPPEETGSEKIKIEESKLDLTKAESVRLSEEEQIKEEKMKGEQKEQFREKEAELERKKQTKAAQNSIEPLTDEPEGRETAKYEPRKEEQVKAEQAERQKPKEDIKTQLTKTEMAEIKQAKKEQAKGKRTNPEQVRQEQTSAEQFVGEQRERERNKEGKTNEEQAEDDKTEKTEQIKEPQTKAKHTKTTEVKADHSKVENIRQAKDENDLNHLSQINTKKPITLSKDPKLEENKPEQAKLEEKKPVRCKTEPSKTENLLERSEKLTAKLAATQQVRNEPDKVEQVKTELAKAKAELAKIKEKMRGEQKEKVRNNPVTKEDGISKNRVPLSLNTDKNKDGKKQEEPVDIQTHRGAGDYERLREKYGFTNAASTDKNKVSTTGGLTSNDANKTEVISVDKVRTENKEKSQNERNLASSSVTANIKFQEEVSGSKHSEVTESQCVHGESSRELKLSHSNYFPTNVSNKSNVERAEVKLKDDGGQKLEKCDCRKDFVSQQKGSDLAQMCPVQRAPESNEHNPGKDLPVTPPRALSHKERAQTKQEILTSKIKAHAEKEISAIKEKGFALREGFMGKNSAKHLASGQTVNIRQKPPSQEVPRNHESTESNSSSSKNQMEPSGVQTEPLLGSSMIKIKPAEPNHKTNSTRNITENKIQKGEGVKSLEQSAEQLPKNNQEEEPASHTDISGRPKEELQQAVTSEILHKNKERTQAGCVKSANFQLMTTEKVESKEAANKDSEPPNVVTDQREATLTDDSLQIVGIMVTVRERKPPVNGDQENDRTERNATEREYNKSGLNESGPSQRLEEITSIKAGDVKKTHSVVKEDPGKNSLPENVQETSTLEPKHKDVTENVTKEKTNRQQEKPIRNVEVQGETQPKSAVTVSAKDKVWSETQTVPFKRDTIVDSTGSVTIKEDNPVRSSGVLQPTHFNETPPKVVNCETNNRKAEALIKEPPVKDLSAVKNDSKATQIVGRSAPLPEGRTCASVKPDNSNNSSDEQNRDEPQKLQSDEKQIKEDNHRHVDVHIDSIAIRVVPALTEENNVEMTEKQLINSFPEQERVVLTQSEEKVTASNSEHCSKSFPSTSSDERKKETLEDKLSVQYVLSSVRKLSDSLKASSKQNNTNAHIESTKVEHGNPESNILPVEGDYFQVQGATETSSKAHSNLTTAEDKLKDRELPGLLPNKTAVSGESKKEGRQEAFVFSPDQSEKKETSGNIQDESMKRKKMETEDVLVSKQTDGSMERCSHREKREAGQLNRTRKGHEENQLQFSTRETQVSRNSDPAKANPVQETPEAKPKPRGRASTVPEISAIADYARLKVIVSEDREVNAVQEFPPNKKEGFFPLIQTRHSRRPVFTDDPQDLSVKDKKSPNKTEVSAKVTKEPKAIVFPIMEKELQRTGMFKLGDKEKQEKMVLDAKRSSGQSANMETYSSPKETNMSAATQKERMAQADRKKPNNDQVTTPSSAANAANNNSSEGLTYLNLPQHGHLGQINHRKENTTPPKRVDGSEKQQAKGAAAISEDWRIERLKNEKLTTQHETKAKQQDHRQQLEEETCSRCEKEKSEKDVRQMLEESRASLAEEEKRATRKEEERRAREREAIAVMIKERREKQRQADLRTGEEGKTKQREEVNVVQKEEEVQAKEKVELPMTEPEQKRRIRADEKLARLRWEENERMRKQEEERAAQEEQQRRLVQEEQRKRYEEQQRRAAQEEQKRRTAYEEQQKREVEEQERRNAQKEQQRRPADRELRQAVQVEQQRRLAQEEQRKRTAHEEQQQREAEEQERRDAQKEQQKKAAREEKQRALQEEQQKREAEEHRRRAAQEIQQRRAAQIEEQRQAKQIKEKIAADILEEQKRESKEEDKTAPNPQAERIKEIQEQKKVEQTKDLKTTQKKEEEGKRAAENGKLLKQRDENQAKHVNAMFLEKSTVAQESILSERDKDTQAKKKEEDKRLAAHGEKTRTAQMERQQRAAQKMDALQYYAISSTDAERKPKEGQQSSPLSPQQKHNQLTLESADDSGPYRPHSAASPAPSLPRSNASSPAPGTKPLMFRVKDNTIRGSSLTKSVKPRFHKNFGEDFWMGSASDRAEDEQEMMRRSAGTPASPDAGFNRFASSSEPSAFPQDCAASISHQRPYSRRSMALDDDESRSVMSNMSEDVESFATSAADLSDIRGLFDHERPESACSFSSDVSRSLGKPPAVPPKSEKALRRAQRLTSRRIKKELSKAPVGSPAGVEKEISSFPPSTEVCSSNLHAVASPHFSPPVAFAHAPALEPRLPSPHTEHQSSHHSFHASPHATGPISLPLSSSPVGSKVSLPSVSLHASGTASKPAAPNTVAHVSSSPTPHLANHHSNPVTQYHVEPSSYHQSYPLTQHKVLQDLGSGQYFLVEVPVQVKTKTFFDPETGKYVQLNVRQSGQNNSQAQPQRTYPHPQLRPQMQIKQQKQPLTQASNAGKPFVFYQGYQGYPQSYQPAVIDSVPSRSSGPAALHQHQQPPRESHLSTEGQQDSEGHRYSPEKTPYMDTVSDTNRTDNPVNSSQDSNESSAVCENNSANSLCQPRDIIAMSELEDFMEVSDW